MLQQTKRDELMELPKYDRIMIYLFRKLADGYNERTLPVELRFNQGDVVDAMRAASADGVIDKDVRNVPDIKYTYDARRELPYEVEQIGPRTWLQDGKGRYVLRQTKRKNIIDFPEILEVVPPTQLVIDTTPQFISELLGKDEQALFTRVRNAGLIDTVLGFKTWPIQGHHRTTVSYGQIEVDEVQAGLDDGKVTLVPISGKGGQDKLSWSQALNLNTYGDEKAPRPGLGVKSLGLWRDSKNTIWMIEFSPETDIDEITITKVSRFKFR